jgi:hypothetical protein
MNVNKCIQDEDEMEPVDPDIYLFGASFYSQILLSLGLDRTKIKGVLDNCKEKHGKVLYGYDLPIYDPVILNEKNSIVILKNGYYVKEIEKQIQEMNGHTTIFS